MPPKEEEENKEVSLEKQLNDIKEQNEGDKDHVDSSQHQLKSSKSQSLDKPHKCTVCGKSFSDKTRLSRHMKVHSEDRPHKCPKCPLAFKLGHSLNRHMVMHDDSLMRECKQCHKKFRWQVTLKKHLEKGCQGHNDKNKIKLLEVTNVNCDTGKPHDTNSISVDSSLPQDIIKVKQKETANFVLPSSTSEPQASSNIFQQKVSKETTSTCQPTKDLSKQTFQKCPICSKILSKKTRLSTHLKIKHSDQKPYKCPKCPAAFKIKWILKNHMKRHKDKLRVKICGKRLKVKAGGEREMGNH